MNTYILAKEKAVNSCDISKEVIIDDFFFLTIYSTVFQNSEEF